MTRFFKFAGPAALCAAFVFACVVDGRSQEKSAPEKAATQKGGKGGKGAFGPKGPKSPEVKADGTVIFRLPLPNLQKVELDGDCLSEGFRRAAIQVDF